MEKRNTVLLVHNSALARQIIRKILADSEFDIIAEANYEISTARFRRYEPDVVLLDAMVPGECGLAVLERIMQINPHATVIILMYMGANENVEPFLQRGAAGVLHSPFVKDLLLSQLRQGPRKMELKEMVHAH